MPVAMWSRETSDGERKDASEQEMSYSSMNAGGSGERKDNLALL